MCICMNIYTYIYIHIYDCCAHVWDSLKSDFFSSQLRHRKAHYKVHYMSVLHWGGKPLE